MGKYRPVTQLNDIAHINGVNVHSRDYQTFYRVARGIEREVEGVRSEERRSTKGPAFAHECVSMYKTIMGCLICLERDFRVLDLHHRDRKLKSFEVAAGVARNIVEIWVEIYKCDVLCSNCHRREHHRLREKANA